MSEEQAKTLEEIKKLLILQLFKEGVAKDEIGEVLGVSYKTIERILPRQKRTKVKEEK